MAVFKRRGDATASLGKAVFDGASFGDQKGVKGWKTLPGDSDYRWYSIVLSPDEQKVVTFSSNEEEKKELE